MLQGAELEALKLINAGISALAEYVALHVLTCLIPAFLIAEAIMAMVNKEVLLSYLGTSASKLKSFPVAIFSSFLLAVCSCTVIPIASGIYHKSNLHRDDNSLDGTSGKYPCSCIYGSNSRS